MKRKRLLTFIPLTLLIMCSCWKIAIGQEVLCPITPVLTVNSNDILCAGQAVNLTATVEVPDGCQLDEADPFIWEATGAGVVFASGNVPNTVIADIPSVIPNAIEITVTPVITNTPDGMCPCFDTQASNIITINVTPDAPLVASPTTTCPGETLTLTAEPADGNFRWYNVDGGLLYEGNPYTTNSLEEPITIVEVTQVLGECEGSPETLFLTTAPISNPTATTPPPACVGNIAEIIVTSGGSNGTIYWYDSETSTSPIHIGNPFYTPDNLPHNNVPYIYWYEEVVGNCVSDRQSVEVMIVDHPAAPEPSAMSPPPTCEGDIAEVIVQSGGSNGAIRWYDSQTSTSPIFTGNPFYTPDNLVSGSSPYTYWFEEVTNGCVSNRQFVEVRIVANPPIPDLTADAVCELSTLELTSNVTGVAYDWVGPDGASFSTIQNPEIPNADLTDEGIYTLTVTSPEGCVAENSIFAAIYPNPPVDAGTYAPIIEGDVLQLQGIGNNNFSWTTNDPTVTFSDPFIPNPTIQPLEAGAFIYTLEMTNEFGCSNTDTAQVIVNESRVLGDPNVGIYNTITPNGDDKNDTWVIPYIENVDNHTIRIFNKEGVLVLNHDSNRDGIYQNDWDASYREKPLPEGVYWYYITASVDDDQYEYKGGLFVKR